MVFFCWCFWVFWDCRVGFLGMVIERLGGIGGKRSFSVGSFLGLFGFQRRAQYSDSDERS